MHTDEHNDDEPVGRVLSRREILTLFGGAGVGLMLAQGGRVLGAARAGQTARVTAATDTPCVVVTPELTEGPYFVDEHLVRADIRTNPGNPAIKPGTPLTLTLNTYTVSKADCLPLSNALVDVWHCDAWGIYSDFEQEGTDGMKFLRGCQTTGKDGKVTFKTIYPGWYEGRAVHVHFKVRPDAKDGKHREFTSQFFFDEDITDEIHAARPYAAKGQNRMRNSEDGIYHQSGGKLLVRPVKTASGWVANLNIAMTSI